MKTRLLLLLCLSMLCFAAKAQIRALSDTMQHDTLIRRYVLEKKPLPKVLTDTLNRVALPKGTLITGAKKTTVADTIPDQLVWTPTKLYGHFQEFRTWSIGMNAGVLSPFLVIGGNNNFTNMAVKLGGGVSIRKQLIHQVGLQFDAITGNVGGSNPEYYKGNKSTISAFNTHLAYAASLSAVFQFGSLDVFHHPNAVNFYASFGSGFIGFAPTVTYANGDVVYYEGHVGFTHEKTFVHELTTLAGLGMRYRINDRFNINGGYTANFVDDDFFDGTYGNTFKSGTTSENNSTNFARNGRKQKYSYGYIGLEVSIGKLSKRNIDWISNAHTVYERVIDSIKTDTVLKTRMASVLRQIDSLKRDADGDGVPDYFDKCPNTPKGAAVDGSGCPITVLPDSSILAKLKKLDTAMAAKPVVYPSILFDFNSSNIPSAYYLQLDAVAKDLIAHPAKKVVIRGYASSEGIVGHNISLSFARANTVKMYLVANGVPASQITAKGYGETQPRANNSSEQGRVLNRRAVFE